MIIKNLKIQMMAGNCLKICVGVSFETHKLGPFKYPPRIARFPLVIACFFGVISNPSKKQAFTNQKQAILGGYLNGPLI